MSVWFRLEVHVSGGVVINSDITDEIAADLLAGAYRYEFNEGDLTDRDKVVRMLATQLGIAIERGTGIFVLDGEEGRAHKWLVRSGSIGAVRISDAEGERRLGFGPLETLGDRLEPAGSE